jgi:UDP-sugar transporter A1/2/3
MRARTSSSMDEDSEAFESLVEEARRDGDEAPPAPARRASDHLAAKVVLILVSSVLIASSGLAVREAEVDGEITYSPLSVTLYSESVKLLLACGITAFGEPAAHRADARALAAFLPGAFGYFVLNNMRYSMIRAVNPGVLAIVWNMKIVTIGLFYAAPPFSRIFTKRQWAGAFLLVAGSTLAELSQWGTKNAEGQSNTGGTSGLAIVAAALVLTSFSAVACEYAYKSTGDLPLSRQNLILYSYGTAFNGATALAWRFLEDDASPWTRGFTAWTWAAVFTQALSGYMIGALLKYVDAVGQVFADVVAMVFSAVVAALFFGLAANLEYGVALLICCGSLVVYYSQSIADHVKRRRELRSDDARAQADARDREARDEQSLGFWASRSPLVVADPKPGPSIELVAARKLVDASDASTSPTHRRSVDNA